MVDGDYAQGLMKYSRLCHHLHLSAQSGSDHVLRLMNRPYTRNDYLDIVRRLRESDPNYGITTDMIAGFPQETPEDFADSLSSGEYMFFLIQNAPAQQRPPWMGRYRRRSRQKELQN